MRDTQGKISNFTRWFKTQAYMPSLRKRKKDVGKASFGKVARKSKVTPG